MQSRQDFVVWEKHTLDTVDFKKVYVDITKDINAGLLLSQIVYWFLPTKDGTKPTKTQVHYQKKDWVVKQRHEWWDEIRLSERQYDRAIKKLKECNVIEIKTKKSRFHGGDRAQHIHLKFDKLTELLNKNIPLDISCTDTKDCQNNQTVITPNNLSVISLNTKTTEENTIKEKSRLIHSKKSVKKKSPSYSEVSTGNSMVPAIDYEKAFESYCKGMFESKFQEVLSFSYKMSGYSDLTQLQMFTTHMISNYGKDVYLESISELQNNISSGVLGYYTPTYVKEHCRRKNEMKETPYIKKASDFEEFCQKTFTDKPTAELVENFYKHYLSTKNDIGKDVPNLRQARMTNISYLLDTVGRAVFLKALQKMKEKIDSGSQGKGKKGGPTLNNFTNWTKSFVKGKTQTTYLPIAPVEKDMVVPVLHHHCGPDEKHYEEKHLNWYYECPKCNKVFDAWANECTQCSAKLDWDKFDFTAIPEK